MKQLSKASSTRPARAPRTLRGIGASGGLHTGLAHIVTSTLPDVQVTPGKVLVIPTMSAKWTTQLATAGAVVSETGGTLADASIIARELGVPCVVGVIGSTEAIDEGDEITVDGNRGTVTIRSRATPSHTLTAQP